MPLFYKPRIAAEELLLADCLGEAVHEGARAQVC